jgi:hypothetical protein
MPYQQKYKAVTRMNSPYAKLGHSNSVAMQQTRYVLESEIEAATEGQKEVPELGGQLQEVIVTANPKTGTTTNSTSSTSSTSQSDTNVKTGKKKRKPKAPYSLAGVAIQALRVPFTRRAYGAREGAKRETERKAGLATSNRYRTRLF